MLTRILIAVACLMVAGQSFGQIDWRDWGGDQRAYEAELRLSKAQEADERDQLQQAPLQQIEEIKALRQEIALLRQLLEKLLTKETQATKLVPVDSPAFKKKVSDYMKSHGGSAPPASWYPNGDPWRNPTAEEMKEAFGG